MPPAPSLATAIEHYWSVSATEETPFSLQVDVYVDARADLVFNFGVPYHRAVRGGDPRELQSSNLDAQRSRPLLITQRGAVSIIGVRFHTAGLCPFVSAPVRPWSDRVVPIAEVFGDDVLGVERDLRAARPDTAAQKQILDDFFTRRWRLTRAKQTLLSLKARIEADGGLVRMNELCDASSISIRQLDRLFRDHLGFNPKTFSRIVRFQRALTQLKADPGCTLAAVAAACGYYDQPHFVREFREFAGVVPSAQVGYFPAAGPADFSPNVVQFLQDPRR